MEFYKMNDKTDIYLSSLRASTKWDSWLYLQSEYAQRINISRRKKIEEKFLVQTEKKRLWPSGQSQSLDVHLDN